jgi:hypothetical protein
MKLRAAAGAVLSILVAIATHAQAAAPQAAGKGAAWPKGSYAQLDRLPDWGGVWTLRRAAPGSAPPAPPPRPALKGEYLARYEAWAKEVRENAGLVRRETSNCMPPGMPGMMGTAQYPIEFLFTPGRVSMHHEAWMQWRTIFTDGRGHPDDWDPGIFGHSIGHWEGDTLVVETTGIKTVTELGGGMKHGPKLVIRERIHLDPKDNDTLVVEMTMEDPDALERPFTREIRFQRQRDWNLMEFICAENDRNPVNEQGYTTLE